MTDSKDKIFRSADEIARSTSFRYRKDIGSESQWHIKNVSRFFDNETLKFGPMVNFLLSKEPHLVSLQEIVFKLFLHKVFFPKDHGSFDVLVNMEIFSFLKSQAMALKDDKLVSFFNIILMNSRLPEGDFYAFLTLVGPESILSIQEIQQNIPYFSRALSKSKNEIQVAADVLELLHFAVESIDKNGRFKKPSFVKIQGYINNNERFPKSKRSTHISSKTVKDCWSTRSRTASIIYSMRRVSTPNGPLLDVILSGAFGYQETKPYLRQLFKQAIYITENVLAQTDMKEVCKFNRDCLPVADQMAVDVPKIPADDAIKLLGELNCRGKGTGKKSSSPGS